MAEKKPMQKPVKNMAPRKNAGQISEKINAEILSPQKRKNIVQEAQETRQPAEAKAGEKKTAKKKGNWLKENKFTAALCIVLVFFVLLSFVNLSTPPKTVDISEFHGDRETNGGGTGTPIPKLFLIYSEQCHICEAGNSFELLLRKNEINFAAKEIEASSPEGAQFVQALGLKKLPALLIDGSTVSDNLVIGSDENFQLSAGSMGLQSFLQLLHKKYPNEAKFDEATGIYVLNELSLDGKAHVDFITDNEGCGPQDMEKIARVDVFVDPYSTPYIKSLTALDEFRDSIELSYHYLPIEASQHQFPADTPWANIETLGRYTVCAYRQDFLREAEEAFYARYCRLNDNNVLDAVEMQNCSDSNHFFLPILGEEGNLISEIDLNYDTMEFAKCLSGFSEKKELDASVAQQLQVYRVPTIVINCQYSTHPLNIKDTLCKANPEIEHCEPIIDPFELE